MIFYKILPISILLACSMANAASYVYITDIVDIPIRSSNAIQNSPSNLLRMLPSGTKLKILATKEGWTKVKFEQTTGWIISRYLTNNPSARDQLGKLKERDSTNKFTISQQKDNNAKLLKELKDLKKNNIDLSIQISKAKAEKEHIQQTYKDALKLEYNNQKLKKQALQLKTEIQLLQNNDITDQDASARNWFIVGAIVLFFGFIIGFIFSKRSPQRRS